MDGPNKNLEPKPMSRLIELGRIEGVVVGIMDYTDLTKERVAVPLIKEDDLVLREWQKQGGIYVKAVMDENQQQRLRRALEINLPPVVAVDLAFNQPGEEIDDYRGWADLNPDSDVPPIIFGLWGEAGAGKTTIINALVEEHGVGVVNLDKFKEDGGGVVSKMRAGLKELSDKFKTDKRPQIVLCDLPGKPSGKAAGRSLNVFDLLAEGYMGAMEVLSKGEIEAKLEVIKARMWTIFKGVIVTDHWFRQTAGVGNDYW